ncbi:MAG: hypothetical protein M3N28_07040 [Actinomycetota bacterium]|nr:hypothetical protein [Actinomycetota bacterium]
MNVTRAFRRLIRVTPTRWRMPSRRALWMVVAILFLSSSIALALHDSPEQRVVEAPAPVEEGLAVQTVEQAKTDSVAPAPPPTAKKEDGRSSSTAKAPPKPKPAPPRRPAGLGGAAGTAAYRGMGTWVDVYDWSATYARGGPQISPDAVDRMAEQGVQTLYIQASKHDAPSDVLEADLLRRWIDKARGQGIRVVAWYLPTLVHPARDLARMRAIGALPVDSVAVDIESKDVAQLEERNRRLVAFSADVRRALPGRSIGGIVLPPVVLEAVNPAYWPSFPYRQLVPYYDVWMTMGYWTNRASGTTYRDANRYTTENVKRLRANLGLPGALVHPIGGIADRTTAVDVAGYRRAVSDTDGIGASLYDWRTTRPELWESLRAFRR